MPELRCDNKLHGLLLDDGVVEMKCNSRFCGAISGVTVLHQFSITTGELLGTETFQDPPKPKKGQAQ